MNALPQAPRAWRFDELVREAMSRVPAHAPGWTDHNPSDPGVTLVELLAHFTEILVYRLGRVTPEARLQFLRLLLGAKWGGWRDLHGSEAIDRAIADAVADLGRQRCAVTPSDFRQLALQAAHDHLGQTCPVHALCLPGRPPAPAGAARARRDEDERAHVTVVLRPWHELPAEEAALLCRQVRHKLQAHCLIGTRLHVIGPGALHVGIGVRLVLRPDADEQAVREALSRRLRQHFGPAEVGIETAAPDPGGPLMVSDLTRLVDETPGVDHVGHLRLLALATDASALVALRSRIGILVGVHATVAEDTWLGNLDPALAARLRCNDACQLVGLDVQPWEVLRVHLLALEIDDGR